MEVVDVGEVLAVGNRKGGVGKTTVTVGLAEVLVAAGRRVLLVDADPQANATAQLGLAGDAVPYTLNDVLAVDPRTGGVPAGVLAEAVVPAGEGWGGLHAVAAEPALAGREQDADILGRELRLRSALEGVRDSWDVVLVDCPPSLGQLTVNALVAADAAVLVTEARAASVEGLAQMTTTLGTVRRHFTPDLRLAGVVVNRYLPGRRDCAAWLEQLRGDYGAHVLDPVLPEREAVAAAASAAAPLSSLGARGREVLAALTRLADHVVPVGSGAPTDR